NVVPIHIPPLRDRREDIPLLVEHFISKFNERLKKQIVRISDEAVARLTVYNWPGNIRELENMMERTMLFCEGPAIHARDLRPEMAPVISDVTPAAVVAAASGGLAAPALAAAAVAARPGHAPAAEAEEDDSGVTVSTGPTTLTSMPAVSSSAAA